MVKSQVKSYDEIEEELNKFLNNAPDDDDDDDTPKKKKSSKDKKKKKYRHGDI